MFPDNQVGLFFPKENTVGLVGVEPLGINFFELAFGVVKKIQSELVCLGGFDLKFGEELVLVSVDVGSLRGFEGHDVAG